MGDTDKEREELKKVYPKSESWAHKVNEMSPAQVAAIYIRFRNEGKLGK
jgi:hypothetical protein